MMNLKNTNLYTIIVVEDEVAIATMYKYKLELAGYTVHMAHNGNDGLRLAEQQKPDLMLVDIRMPVMTGDEMLEAMRATDWGSKPRVIVLTNISKSEAPTNLRFLNIDRYVVKAHHTPQQVLEIVQEILGA